LRSVLPDFLLLEDLIAIAIEVSLLIGLDGSPLSISSIVGKLADQNISVVLRKLGQSCIVSILSNARKDLSVLLAVFTEEVKH
jgi:hypothetical protein